MYVCMYCMHACIRRDTDSCSSSPSHIFLSFSHHPSFLPSFFFLLHFHSPTHFRSEIYYLTSFLLPFLAFPSRGSLPKGGCGRRQTWRVRVTGTSCKQRSGACVFCIRIDTRYRDGRREREEEREKERETLTGSRRRTVPTRTTRNASGWSKAAALEESFLI